VLVADLMTAESPNLTSAMKLAPGAIERIEACRVLLQSFVEVGGEWLLVLDAKTGDEVTRLWLGTIEEPVSMPSMEFVDVCYRMRELGGPS
jgi:hypothetical protein